MYSGENVFGEMNDAADKWFLLWKEEETANNNLYEIQRLALIFHNWLLH